MASYTNAIVQGEPTSPSLTITGVTANPTPRITPRIRAGNFWIGDRRHYLPSRKAACYLEDITWHVFQLSDSVIPGTETVWVRGIDITSTTQYYKDGRNLFVSGGALNHPGTRWSQLNQGIGYSAYLARDMMVPGDEIRIEYDTYQWSNGNQATAGFVNGANAGIDITAIRPGTWGNQWTFEITAATGNPASATIDYNALTVTLDEWNAASTTVQQAIDAFNLAAPIFLAEHDGVASAANLLATTVTALGGAPLAEPLVGGLDSGNTIITVTEIFDIVDGDVQYKFDLPPRAGSTVVITDDRMRSWDGRDISPEFSINDSGVLEFSVPRNYIANPDFEGEPTEPILWSSTGTPTMAVPGDYGSLTPRSGSYYVRLPNTATLYQAVPAWDDRPVILSFAYTAAVAMDVTIEFFDNTWTSLGTDSFTAPIASAWSVINRRYGPSGTSRVFDDVIPNGAEYAVITFDSNSNSTTLDYVFWGPAVVDPDHWHPHPFMTVEFDVGEDYYEHHPNIGFLPDGEPYTNPLPQAPTNLDSASNYETTGFLYWVEDETPDFSLGLGGRAEEMTAVDSDDPLRWVLPAISNVFSIIPDGEGGFYVGGATSIRRIDRNGEQDAFVITTNGNVRALMIQDGILYAAGDFTQFGGIARNRLAAWDLASGQVTTWNPGASVTVTFIGPGAEGTIIIAFAGINATIGGQTRDCFAVVDSDGTTTAFDPAGITGGEGLAMVFDPVSGYYYGAGTFTTAGTDGLRRWDGTGTLDGTFTPDPLGLAARSLVLDAENRLLYVGGSFTSLYATTRNRAALIDISTAAGALEPWDPDLDDTVSVIHRVGSVVYLGGAFTTVGGNSISVAVSVDDTTGLPTGWVPAPTIEVRGFASTDKVLAMVGSFTTVKTFPRAGSAYYALLDGAERKGRRHTPYAKVDGLGKLAHDSILLYNARPWVREATSVGEIPIPGEIRVDINHLVRIDNGNALTADPVAGDTQLALTVAGTDDHVTNVQREAYAVITDSNNREVIQFKSFESGLNELAKPVTNTFSSASVDILYPVLAIFEGQLKYLRGKLVDANGAPLPDFTVTASAITGAKYELQNTSDVTNQDGEFKFLLLGVTAGAADFVTINAGTVERKVSIRVSTLP